MALSEDAISCLKWWISKVGTAFKPISRKPSDIAIESDSSMDGWGVIDKTNHQTISGLWSHSEKLKHINFLETKAAFANIL